ncbi:MAG TPA: hypothetical protein VGC30_15860 [Dokdonella sp.]
MNASIDTFDSRALRYVDCYGQRFMREGTYRYHVLSCREQGLASQPARTIKVVPRSGEGKNGATMTQHSVPLRWTRGRFASSPVELEIEVGDLVLWNCPDPAAPAYEIVGDPAFFASTRLVNECGFTHAFGTPGSYAWADAHGSGLEGTVHVKEVACKTRGDLERWQQQLAQAALVMIADGKVRPHEVEIVTGQTVYFAIVTCGGISITDKRLLDERGGDGRAAVR